MVFPNNFRPGRCFTGRHHTLGDYDPAADYREHWCELEENESSGWFPGMHLDHCIFPPIFEDEACSLYEKIEFPQGH